MTTGTASEPSYPPAEAAERTGLSLDTLRYYERIGLLRAVPRTAGGRRRYRGTDLDVLALMSCLRDTGMPVRDMQRYAALLHVGDATEPDRLALLREHRQEVDRRIARLEAQAARIDEKIAYYEGPDMRAHRIGDRAVSALCLGTMYFGTTVEEKTSFAILDRFVEAGGTFLDTADNYAFWADGATGDESETVLGRWLASRGTRDQVFLATKLGARPRTPGAGLEDKEGLSAGAVRAALDGSRRRLGVERVDLLYTHLQDPATPLAETLGALAAAHTRGEVDVLGASNLHAWELERARAVARAHGWPVHRVAQLRHSAVRPRPGAPLDAWMQVVVGDAELAYARAEPDVTLTGYSPLLGGAFSRPDRPLEAAYDHPGTTRRLAALRGVADELGASVNAVVLAWMLAGDPPVLPVLGVSSVAQLDEALAAADLVLDDAQRSRIDAAT